MHEIFNRLTDTFLWAPTSVRGARHLSRSTNDGSTPSFVALNLSLETFTRCPATVGHPFLTLLVFGVVVIALRKIFAHEKGTIVTQFFISVHVSSDLFILRRKVQQTKSTLRTPPRGRNVSLPLLSPSLSGCSEISFFLF